MSSDWRLGAGRRSTQLCLASFVFLLLEAVTSEARADSTPTLRVASKAFTESVILAELVTQLERAAGIRAEHRPGLGGTRLVWNALLSGAIDVYPEYTGTLRTEILRSDERPVPDAADSSRAWLRQALGHFGVQMSEPLGFDNSYAIGVSAALARAQNLKSISDLRGLRELRFGFSNEFLSRQDGWPLVRDRYGLPQTRVQGLDHDLAYRALVSGAIDATDVYTTDAEIPRYDLRPLQDDLQLFPRYEAVLLYRSDVPVRFGKRAALALAELEGRISAPAMSALNARAKLDHVAEARVASEFLRAHGSRLAGSAAQQTVLRGIAARVLEHLLLVGISLLGAILIAVPLGIFAARRPKLGQVVLAVVGVVQTIPTLALLVFMIPLFGIGETPAIAALFLYSLLPIVRNTHAGLLGIPSSLLESAEALGLPRSAILRLVELPLASPLILAGIKSAAVINVGTATLGALIGAGGLGQPIFTGIRLDDLALILQGAIPASLLALLVQGSFELIERRVVPRGLKRTPL